MTLSPLVTCETLRFICKGLQFLRFICLLNTPELLQLLHIIKRNSHIRVVKVVTIMLIVWMLGASMYFLVSSITVHNTITVRPHRSVVSGVSTS